MDQVEGGLPQIPGGVGVESPPLDGVAVAEQFGIVGHGAGFAAVVEVVATAVGELGSGRSERERDSGGQMSMTSRRVALRAGVAAVATAAVFAGSFLTTANTAVADQPSRAGSAAAAAATSGVLESGKKLEGGQEIESADGEFTLRMQADGNLVLINTAGKVLFHMAPNAGAVATMQADGNLTVTKNGKALFSTGTQGKNVTLRVQDDENLTLRTPDGKVLWARR